MTIKEKPRKTKTKTITKAKKIRWFYRFYTDGESGKFSSTTLRTWLLFLLLFFYALILGVAVLSDLFLSNAKNFKDAFDMLELLGLIFAGGGTLYLGKRIATKNQKPPENFQ